MAALLGGFLVFNGAATPQKAATMAQSALQKQYPGANVEVQIEGKRGVDVLKGRFRRVRVGLSDVALADLPFTPPKNPKKIGRAAKIEVDLKRITWGNVPIDTARLDFQQVEYDFEALRKQSQFQIVKMGPSQMRVQLRGESLRPLFAARLQNIDEPEVHLEGNGLRVTGARTVLGLRTPVELTAGLIGVGNEVRLFEPQIRVGGVALPAVATASLTKDVGSLYAFDREGRWPFTVRIDRVTAQNETLGIETSLTLKPVVGE
ncbi:MAG TPA: LmeA family phospholipid-binding protein [Abditibacterium sp.]